MIELKSYVQSLLVAISLIGFDQKVLATGLLAKWPLLEFLSKMWCCVCH